MRLRVVVPQLETNMPQGVVSKWYVEEGDPVTFGQPICDLAVSERIRINQVRRADALIRRTRTKKNRDKPVEVETESDRFVVTYQVLASESATIVRRAVTVGSAAQVGELLAVADSDAQPSDENPSADLSSAPIMRVVARLRELDDMA